MEYVSRRMLKDEEKLDYISAVICLKTLPSKGQDYSPAQSRFDDFAAMHIMGAAENSHHDSEWRKLMS
jgi:hypothetical protein